MRRYQKLLVAVLFVLGFGLTVQAEPFTFQDQKEEGRITLLEDGTPVYSFNYKPRLKDGVDEKYRRTGYFHPVYDLDGKSITDDFPDDHPHHRGLWLSWPWMKYEGKNVQLWHPSPLKQQFDRVVYKRQDQNKAQILLRNNWVLDGETIGRARWLVTSFKRMDNYRVIDFKIDFVATKKPIKVRGKQNNNKGYGGLTLRAHPSLKEAQLLTDKGSLEEDATNKEFKWADISTDKRGVAVLVHPDNPNAPQPWLLRNSYAGILNPEWPGLKKTTLEPGKEVTLKYRVVIHKGRMSAEQLQKLHETGAW